MSFPRVGARCDYQQSVRFEDLVEIEVSIVRLGQKSLTFEFNFSHQGAAVASGQLTTVCCRFATDGTPQSTPIPQWMAEKLQAVTV
jgi:4-hydroxybenzoyl-CoA thioesterase/acyl-CoA thioester hydrolase